MAERPFEGTAKTRYEKLKDKRSPYIVRARDNAKVTIPFIMPVDGATGQTDVATPWQGLGARGVRTLASKLLQALFPPELFFKYALDELTTQQIAAKDQAPQDPNNPQAQPPGKAKGDFDAALNARERGILSEFDTSLFRVAAVPCLMHLLVTGNYLLNVPVPLGRVRGWRLDQYVVRRDPTGVLLELIIEDRVAPASLPKEARGLLKPEEQLSENDISLFTHIYLDPTKEDTYVVYQAVGDVEVAGTEGTYKKDALPWIAARLSTQPGEDYGRSYVEEFLGDLEALESLREDVIEASGHAARVVTLVNPNGSTSLKKVADAPNGATIPGKADDVAYLRMDKGGDLQVTAAQIQSLEQSLAYSFLLNTAIQRPQERVTAEEIRYMAAELDAALGGMYTVLGAEIQLSAVLLMAARMEKNKKQAPLPKDIATAQITTGIQALSRSADQRNLKAFLKDVVEIIGPEALLKEVKKQEFIKRSGAAYGVDTNGLFEDPAVIAANAQQEQMMAMAQQLGPQAIQAMGGLGKEAVKNPNVLPALAAQMSTPPQQ